MTRMPNVITVTADTSIIAASKLLLKHNVDSLPVVQNAGDTHVIGKLQKTEFLNISLKPLSHKLFVHCCERLFCCH